MYAAPAGAERFIHVVRALADPGTSRYRRDFPDNIVPVRGYRAPILDRAGEKPSAQSSSDAGNAREIAAAECVSHNLAPEGLLTTLARVIRILGPERFISDPASSRAALEAAGVPVDLLACFTTSDPATATTPRLVSFLARRLSDGDTIESLKPVLDQLPFRFARSHPGFRVSTESGEDELGVLRVQLGGGYDDGIIPGGSIDLICQLVGAFPSVDFLISVPDSHLDPFRQLASGTWRLRRTNHVTLIAEPLPVAAWAQDNGKAGIIEPGPAAADSASPARIRLATLAPRYASIGTSESHFQKGESFLMDGLKATGHAVVQSPLLFQGGNLLAARDPKSGERLLLVGEAELHRNIALGLTRAQALEAFREEFGVDRCVVVPAASYHLDFDVCLRAREGELIAFVNDTPAAARAIIRLGLGALEKSGAMDSISMQTARDHLDAGRELDLVRHLRTALPGRSPAAQRHPATLSRWFASGQADSAEGNFQCFLAALDVVESSLEISGASVADPDPGHTACLQALRRLDAARLTQVDVFKKQGWKVVFVPSMTDLYRGINYLNGVHHRQGYVMPVFGGFYAPLDQAATAAFRSVLGPALRITPILSAESQRHHGGVHCAAAAYPRL